jgi:hypothetical protein
MGLGRQIAACFILVCALAALAGCGTKPPRPPAQEVLAPTDADRAYVVYGLASDGPAYAYFGMQFDFFEVTWVGPWTGSPRAVELNSKQREIYDLPIHGQRPLISPRAPAETVALWGAEPPISEPRYFLASVLPGTYFMSQATARWGGNNTLTMEYLPRSNAAYIQEVLASGRVPQFTINAGELLYIGNFHFKVDGRAPLLSKYELDKAAAEQFVKRYPNLSSPLTAREILKPARGP